jgi:hypothetical protein
MRHKIAVVIIIYIIFLGLSFLSWPGLSSSFSLQNTHAAEPKNSFNNNRGAGGPSRTTYASSDRPSEKEATAVLNQGAKEAGLATQLANQGRITITGMTVATELRKDSRGEIMLDKPAIVRFGNSGMYDFKAGVYVKKEEFARTGEFGHHTYEMKKDNTLKLPERVKAEIIFEVRTPDGKTQERLTRPYATTSESIAKSLRSIGVIIQRSDND